MVVMAEAFLQVLEANAMNDAIHLQPPLIPLSFFRYVDDSHSRFDNMDSADKFLQILNQQHGNIKYTIERECPDNKELQFLDIKIINRGTGKYEFDVFRKEAITNVQVKPKSGHDPNILKGIFKGFVYRALSICSERYLNAEIDFLINVFNENGYDKDSLRKMANDIKRKRTSLQQSTKNLDVNTPIERITLPWIPKISPKLRTMYKKAGYHVSFKSGRNLSAILCAKNKTKLPKDSYPGVYQIPCSCGVPAYRGETKKRICTRIEEHKINVEKDEVEKSALALHNKQCTGEISFEKAGTVAVINNKFKQKVRETLEIQKHDCHISVGGINPDKGQYATTTFWVPLLNYLRKSEGGGVDVK